MIALALFLVAACAARPSAEGFPLGAYLSAKVAESRFDLTRAAALVRQVREADPDNVALRRWAFMLLTGSGERERSLLVAREIVDGGTGAKFGPAVARVAVDAMRRGEWDRAVELFRTMPDTGLDGFVREMGLAWAAQGGGDTDAALEAFDRIGKVEGFAGAAALHRALLLDVAGRPEEAREAFAGLEEGSPPSRTVLALAGYHAREGDAERAQALLDGISGSGRYAFVDFAADMVGPPADSPLEGFAEALFGLAAALSSGNGHGAADVLAMVHARMALMADPGFDAARMLIGDTSSARGRHREALEAFEGVPAGSPYRRAAVLRAAQAHNALDRVDDAVAVLEAVAAAETGETPALLVLGDILRRRERWDEARGAYDRAIARLDGRAERRHWPLFFGRGVVFERTDRWPSAERDFLKALELVPDQALVLNYLGYSWIDQGENLDRAERMVAKAVSLRPKDGFISDSLGWAYYRTGRFAEAVEELERAIALEPLDPVINEHLGDAYWRVGRRVEARIQWRRALGLDPEEERREGLNRRLECGLGCVGDPVPDR